MASSVQTETRADHQTNARTMRAAVYRGVNDVRIEEVPVPEIGPGELLIRVHTCGICGTDLKKITTASHSAPRIFGHETSGTVAAMGRGVRDFALGDRVMVFHHIPCGACFYCRNKVFAQCPVYKKVGVTAGFEPSGGGFAEYVRVMDWIVAGPAAMGWGTEKTSGVVKVPGGVSLEAASFVEPVNTCLKAIQSLRLQTSETVLVIGAGPIGILMAWLAARAGATVVSSDLFPPRLNMAAAFGAAHTVEASKGDPAASVRELTEGRGADAVILAVGGTKLIAPAIQAARPGGRVMLFAQTIHEQAGFDPAAVCVDEKTLLGSYSASVELQAESTALVFGQAADLERLITHRFPLTRAVEGLQLAMHPEANSLKIVIQPALMP
jgi:L-iditol 2-dehydrogenase